MRPLRAFGRPLGAGVSLLCLLALPAGAERSIEFKPCHLDGLAEEVRCGVLEVPEDRAQPNGRRIPIHLAVVPALRRDVLPDPLFLLAGGPGQGARGLARAIAHGFEDVRRQREIVLVDLRGTGASSPLNCPSGGDALTAIARGGGLGFDAAACLRAQSADVRFYANEAAMADLDAVRAALGYERINLWGGSYGTRAALVYARLYPERVRSAVLDGAAPFDIRFPLTLPATADAALEKLFADCVAETACAKAHPNLRSELAALLERLRAVPAHVLVRHPRSGGLSTVTVDEATVAVIVRGALYVPEMARLLPHALERAAQGSFEPLLALSVETASWATETMALGTTLSVICTEDVPRVSAAEAARAVAGHTLGRTEVADWLAGCRAWRSGPLPARVGEVIPLAIPALVLSGGLDPVTPPALGELMRRHFARSWHLVVEKAGHNVSFTGCVPRLIAAFINAASGDHLAFDCARQIQRPPFFIAAAERAAGGAP